MLIGKQITSKIILNLNRLIMHNYRTDTSYVQFTRYGTRNHVCIPLCSNFSRKFYLLKA